MTDAADEQAIQDAYNDELKGLFVTLVDNFTAANDPALEMTWERALADFDDGFKMLREARVAALGLVRQNSKVNNNKEN